MICRKEININIIHNSICNDSKKNKNKVVIKDDYNNIDYINIILHDDNKINNYIIY